jgi:hypothetical protein
MRLPLKGFSRINKIREKIIYFYSLSVNYKVLPLCQLESRVNTGIPVPQEFLPKTTFL